MRFFLTVTILIGFASPVWANGQQAEPATLSVSARGVVQLKPDTAIIRLAVETAGESLNNVQQENQSKMQQIIDRLLQFRIDPERIQTTSFSVTPRYAPKPRRQPGQPVVPQPPKIIGYTVTNSITVEVHELDTVGRVVDRALDAGANRFSGISWVLQDEHPARLRALKAAAIKAREKARTLAGSLDVNLVRLMTVNEGGHHVVYPKVRSLARANMAMAEATGGSVPLSPGELKVEAQVTLVFEIRD